ncbi:MAG: aldehyde ferredoxin oxidoreductase family protein [Desulfosarcinaceae bacterium]|nr:aldehyde ferredoxin oxidoreductase family protein [Desulfosarcinaceae bacterium]
MRYGYAGTILRIDLDSGAIQKQPLPEALADKFIGGRGFVAKTLFDELLPDIQPFDPENRFIMATGPLSGHLLPASGKTHFGAKSPANGGYADSNMGGHFGPQLKYAGYDMLILTGRASAPSLIVIEDASVQIRSAEAYWGQGAIVAETQLKRDLGDDYQILTIGPAGEKLVRYACISHDFGRQAGRTGIGAVLGSKLVKAIAIKGTGSLPVHDVEAAYRAGKEAYAKVTQKPGFKEWVPEGTAGITDFINEVGVFPTRNFQSSYSEHHKAINGKAILKELKITDKGCYGCPTPCGKYGHAKTKSGEAFVEGPEFETIALFGGNCLLPTISDVAYANYLCDELGVDTISAGVVISWAIECYEKGILGREEIGREIAFGELETVEYLLAKIAAREGIGHLLAEGVKAAAEKTGQGSDRFAIHVKGLEWSGYECRNSPSMMLAYMTADIGAHHARAWVVGHDLAGSWSDVNEMIASAGEGPRELPEAVVKPECADYVIESQHVRPLFDALGICRLQFMELGFEPENYEKLFHCITGQKRTWEELLAVSERIWTLTRAISLKEVPGFGRAWDFPPERFSTEPITSGPNKGRLLSREKLERLLDWYYRARGWDAEGRPTRETYARMGLADEAHVLSAMGLCRPEAG